MKLQETVVGQAASFFPFAAINFASVAYIYLAVPETKNRTLEEIQAMLKQLT